MQIPVIGLALLALRTHAGMYALVGFKRTWWLVFAIGLSQIAAGAFMLRQRTSPRLAWVALIGGAAACGAAMFLTVNMR